MWFSPENEQSALEEAIERVLATLSEREAKVLLMRFGFVGDTATFWTLERCGKVIGVSGQRVRQIEDKALRKLRHPTRLQLMAEDGIVQAADAMEHNRLEAARRRREEKAFVETRKLDPRIIYVKRPSFLVLLYDETTNTYRLEVPWGEAGRMAPIPTATYNSWLAEAISERNGEQKVNDG